MTELLKREDGESIDFVQFYMIKVIFKNLFIQGSLILCCMLFLLVGFNGISQNLPYQFEGSEEPLEWLNSATDENMSMKMRDGESLLFVRKNHPLNPGKAASAGAIWFTDINTKELALLVADPTNPRKYFSPMGVLGDRFVYNQIVPNGPVFAGSIKSARIENGQLVDIKDVEIEYFHSVGPHQSGFISANGQYMLLSMEGRSTYGVEDLYVCFRQSDGSWSMPRNLGNQVNTPFQEFTPFLADDNRTLVFATNGRKDGYGSFDLYVTQRLDDTWQNWSLPVNLGAAINTVGAEMAFSHMQGEAYAYYSSTTNSDGYGDIKRIKLKSEILPDETEVVANIPFHDQQKVRNEAVLIAVNAKTNTPIEAEIKWKDQAAFSPWRPQLNDMEDLSISLKARNYMDKSLVITSSQLHERDTIFVQMEPLVTGNVIVLNNIMFHRGTANFIEGSQTELDKLYDLMIQYPNMSILLKGHTDNQGDPQLNLELSFERVRVVAAYLIKKGIAFDRINSKGYGGNQPIAPNDTETNRSKNRRVEFEIVKF